MVRGNSLKFPQCQVASGQIKGSWDEVYGELSSARDSPPSATRHAL